MISYPVRFLFITILVLLAIPAVALDLPANAQRTIQHNSKLDSYLAPVSPFKDGEVQTVKIEGKVLKSAWRMRSSGLTTLQVLHPLRAQLVADGYTILLDCDQTECGGFDFRFAIEVLQSPEMYVNLQAFRFLTAIKGSPEAPSEVITLLASVSKRSAFVQVIQAGKITNRRIAAKASVPKPQPVTEAIPTSLDEALLTKGSVVLNGLTFATGTSNLGKGPFPVLEELATFFKSRDDIRLVLVGHTDSVGSLQSNIALSKRRSTSVRKYLIKEYGLDAKRVFAEGNGYLSPLRSNFDEAGRKANRRVEAIILPLK